MRQEAKQVMEVAHVWKTTLLMSVIATLLLAGGQAWAQNKTEKVFAAVITDAQGVETEVKNVLFYWEEKVSETSFVPHALKQVPVKRGTTTVNVKFEIGRASCRERVYVLV